MSESIANKPATSPLFYQTEQQRPLFAHSEGIYLWDKSGKRYIDGSSGAMVSNIGHSNPRVLAAMSDQMSKGTFAYRLHFESEPAVDLANRLIARAPGDLDRVFFVSGGSEAIESCLKLARQWAVATNQGSRHKVISLKPSYHGCTLGALSLTGYSPLTDPFQPMMAAMPKIPAPRCYLDRAKGETASDEELGLRYAETLRKEILQQGPENVLAFIYEPVGGASTGALVAPASFHQRVQEICKEFGVLLILDEVMSGIGRTGRFLAAEHWNLQPDMVALSKGIGSGYVALGAMVASSRLVDPVLASGGFLHGFTNAGSPLACAAGLAVLDEIEEADLVANSERMGELLSKGLLALQQKFPFIGDVRGKGLLQAFEIVADNKTLEPLAADLHADTKLVEIAYQRGLIIYSRRSRGGYSGDHFLVCPPLIINEEQLAEILAILEQSLQAFAEQENLNAKTYKGITQ